MREVVPEAFLRDEISKRMASEGTITNIGSDPKAFTAMPERCAREEDGPNWRLAFDPEKVLRGYADTWERIRHEFEDRYDMEEV